ncbi:hypothetical protein KVV02_006244 [Mortierella alpina]|uniref:SGTA homodimerisation domain-containing protein n=1 Tax=Mortierella alpina TaxID=64518 RepID=A0A9P8A2X1_MORAP|nr:hypothetical protein KVV02_006244 [Mortierella alpina]
MADDKQKHLVFSILEFLQASLNNGTIKPDDSEGVEVAIQCIGEAFGVDLNDSVQAQTYSTKPATLVSIFDVFVNAQKKLGNKSTAAASASASSTSAPAAKSTPLSSEPTDEEKKNAEELKVAGNRKVNEKDYAEAIRLYGEAIVLNPKNAVYYANRAAAYSQMGDHQNAITDSLKAAEVDPSYSKAYSRLGHAYFSVGKYKEAVTAYEKGLTLEPNNATMKSSLATARTKARDNEVAPSARGGAGAGPGAGAGAGGLPPGFPDLSALGGGAGGMPDLAGLMSNPALMNMAQQMMQSGALNSLMSNPAMQQMAQRMMAGGERPNIDEMMRDPEIAEAARGLMGNMGGMPGAGGAPKPPQGDDEML